MNPAQSKRGHATVKKAIEGLKQGITNMMPAYRETYTAPDKNKARKITPQEMKANDYSKAMNKTMQKQKTFGAPGAK